MKKHGASETIIYFVVCLQIEAVVKEIVQRVFYGNRETRSCNSPPNGVSSRQVYLTSLMKQFETLKVCNRNVPKRFVHYPNKRQVHSVQQVFKNNSA